MKMRSQVAVTIAVLLVATLQASADEWQDPYENFSVSTGLEDESRVVLLLDRGVQLPSGETGGAIRLHRYLPNGEIVWRAFLKQFHGLLMPRGARLAIVEDQVVVALDWGAQYAAVDLETGEVSPLAPDHPLVQSATRDGLWTVTKLEEPEPSTYLPQKGSLGEE